MLHTWIICTSADPLAGLVAKVFCAQAELEEVQVALFILTRGFAAREFIGLGPFGICNYFALTSPSEDPLVDHGPNSFSSFYLFPCHLPYFFRDHVWNNLYEFMTPNFPKP